eukprot:TRINITY_DN5759_c0_g1_i3.p1 TRINITY_DN5759_c0_g1~~TRINITY_DN5759_c0_g1_i3.p1  ORF type:complete len:320 (+),score=72.95 TRINITY_DN5759_c0_g1_i3:131-1090(+)
MCIRDRQRESAKAARAVEKAAEKAAEKVAKAAEKAAKASAKRKYSLVHPQPPLQQVVATDFHLRHRKPRTSPAPMPAAALPRAVLSPPAAAVSAPVAQAAAAATPATPASIATGGVLPINVLSQSVLSPPAAAAAAPVAEAAVATTPATPSSAAQPLDVPTQGPRSAIGGPDRDGGPLHWDFSLSSEDTVCPRCGKPPGINVEWKKIVTDGREQWRVIETQECFGGQQFFKESFLRNPVLAGLKATPEELTARGAVRFDAQEKNKTCRYHLYSFLATEGLHYQQRHELPWCLVAQIRQQYPDPNGVYKGFQGDLAIIPA